MTFCVSFQLKVDEYFLGKTKTKVNVPKRDSLDDDEDDDDDLEEEEGTSEKPPTFYFNGKSYAYYEVEMDGGTVCDISNEPRSIKIKYICDMESHQSGTVSVCVCACVCACVCVHVSESVCVCVCVCSC